MAMDAAEIERLIKESIPDARVNIEDLRGDGDHYAATVISAAFTGKTRVQQHQMVYQALRGRMGEQLHALALQTSAPPQLIGTGEQDDDRYDHQSVFNASSRTSGTMTSCST
jgi:Stress-induced morphogen (activity unknown)